MGVNHRGLLEKIDGYIKRFGVTELFADFYIPSKYKTLNGRTMRNYLITKKSQMYIFNKLKTNSALRKNLEDFLYIENSKKPKKKETANNISSYASR
ncbi:hypothetical protein FUSNEC_GEN_277_05100 [Fusobacterium necrophorum subsp. funduliforme]